MSADAPPTNPENGYANFTAPIACKMPVPAPPGSLGIYRSFSFTAPP
jgi:hypothetical protein